MKWSITYSKTTPESAEQGDNSEHGWWMPGECYHPLSDSEGHHDEVVKEAIAGEFDQEGSLSELLDMAQSLGICTREGADWFYSYGEESMNSETGETTGYCLHLHESSARHFDRVARFITH